MTLATTIRKTIALGNGATTVFNYTFLIQSSGQLTVLYTNADGNASVLAPGTYTVAGVGSAGGGTVTYPLSGSPIATGTKLTMYRLVTVQQLASIINQGSFNPIVIEAALDYLTMIDQQVIETVGRGLVVPIDDVNPIVTLPGQKQRSNAGAGGLALGFDLNGDPTLLAGAGALTVAAFMTTFLTKTSAALARAYLGSTTVGDAVFIAANAATARATLGLGTAAVVDTGTSGAVVPLLSGNNKHTGSNTYQERVNAANIVGGTADAITATFNPAFTALVDKMRVTVRATAANTGAATFVPDGVGSALPISKTLAGGVSALAAGDIMATGHNLDLVYDLAGPRWILQNPRNPIALSAYDSSLFSSPAAQTPVASTTLTFAHGLGTVPSIFIPVLVAGSVPEHGYAAGDEVQLLNNRIADNQVSLAAYANATNVKVIVSTGIRIMSITTGDIANATLNDATKWQVKIRAWK